MIGRSDLDGQNVNQSFITGLREPLGVAVDSGHIYWANVPWIGRADLEGQNVNKYFIYAPGYPVGVAVDSSHIYWADNTLVVRHVLQLSEPTWTGRT